ncbi:MAG TPA: hypothetical protein VFK13_04245 [Gemmatimonadaceae bacterium]|nr:hypothetical protein [Gemmatimonadaceae bacterium]
MNDSAMVPGAPPPERPGDAASRGAGAAAGAPARVRIIRWSGVVPLLLVILLLVVGWLLFGDRVVTDTAEEVGTETLGTSLQIDGLHIHEADASVTIDRLQLADPFDRMRNLVEGRGLELAVDPEPLLEKKLVVRRLVLGDVRFGTHRDRPAPPAPPNGFAAQTIGALREWRQQFAQPLLSFTPVDTIRAIVLDPAQLRTVQSASALVSGADSLRTTVETRLHDLRARETLDTARALAERLQGANLKSLGVTGVRQAVTDVRRTLSDIQALRARVDTLRATAQQGAARLDSGVHQLDAARREDYAFARSLLHLPTLEGPQLGQAMFGDVSLDRMQQVMYWAELARKYMPPGLLPRASAAPTRLRRAGETVRFPGRQSYPAFLLERGTAHFAITRGGDTASYAAAVADLTSAPTLVGRPMRVVARQTGGRLGVSSLSVDALLDHTRAVPLDSVVASVGGIAVPGFAIPKLPVRVEPGNGSTSLVAGLRGDNIAARWTLRAPSVTWHTDSTARALTPVESVILRVLSGVRTLEVSAELSGPIRHPQFSVSSNVDQALAASLRDAAGQAFARAEARARAAVDSIVAARVAPLRARAESARDQALAQVTQAQQEVEARRQELEERLRSLTGGLGGIRIPGVSP